MSYFNKQANDVLTAHWNGNIPVDIVSLLKVHNIDLLRLDMPEGVRGKMEVTDNRAVIYYNPANSLVVNRFMGAHLLGRFLMGYGGIDELTVANFNSEAYDGRDRASNDFAIHLLIPQEALKFYAGNGTFKDVAGGAKFFCVAPVAMSAAIGKMMESMHVPATRQPAPKLHGIEEDILAVTGVVVGLCTGLG